MPTELTPPPPPPDASSTPPPPPPHSSSTNDKIAIDVDDDVRMKRVPSSDDPLNLQLVAKPVQLCRNLSLSDELPWVQVAQKYSITARPPDQRRRWRCTRKLKAFKQGFLNLLACIVVASQTVCNTEAVLGCLITVASVLGYWCWGRHLAARMNWSIVSLAVVFPITQGIGMGFRRREEALRDLSQLLGCTRSVWEAVHTWRIKNQQGEWVRCVEAYEVRQRRELQQLFHSFLAALITYFDCVRGGRARHTVGWSLEEQAAVFCTCSSPPPPPPPSTPPPPPSPLPPPPSSSTTLQAALFCTLREQRAIVDSHISQMRRLIQDVKTRGLPGGEAHRIDNYVNMMGMAFDRLCAIKEYRTPRAFRAFARVYILLVGAMYGPDYLMLARGEGGHGPAPRTRRLHLACTSPAPRLISPVPSMISPRLASPRPASPGLARSQAQQPRPRARLLVPDPAGDGGALQRDARSRGPFRETRRARPARLGQGTEMVESAACPA